MCLSFALSLALSSPFLVPPRDPDRTLERSPGDVADPTRIRVQGRGTRGRMNSILRQPSVNSL